jgi:Superfamily I DNA and RNA helicases
MDTYHSNWNTYHMPGLSGTGQPTTAPRCPEMSVSYKTISTADTQPIHTSELYDIYRVEVQHGNSTTPLAIKQPATDQTISAAFAERFSERAEKWAALSAVESADNADTISAGDHIVDVIEWSDSPVPWLALEYMDGGSLATRLESGDLPLEQALWIGYSVCRALLHAHQNGVVHQDIKPGNILFRQTNGRWPFPKIGDWGSAKTLMDTIDHQDMTVSYAAPEQLDSDSFGQPDQSTDLYQVGTLVYRLVTGKLPFDGDAATIRQHKLTTDPIPPSHRADVPEAFDEVLMPAIQQSKTARYDTIAYLRDELDGLRDVYGQNVGISIGSSMNHHNTGLNEASQAVSETRSAATDTTQHDQSNDEFAADRADSVGSWEKTRERLDERKNRRTYAICPDFLRGLFFATLEADIESAETRRDDCKSQFDELRTEAREQRHLIEEEAYNAQLLGEAFADDANETARRLEQLQTDLGGLLGESRDYLRASEQRTIETLCADLHEYEQYLRSKYKLTQAVETIGPKLESATESVDTTLSEGQLLTTDQEDEMMSSLNEISQSLRTVRQQLRTEPLSDADLRQLDTMVETEASLRSQVTDNNPNIAQSRVATLIADIEPIIERVNAALQDARQEGAPLPVNLDELQSEIERGQSRLAEFQETRAPEYLTDPQREQITTFQSELQAAETFIRAKSDFEGVYERLETELRECSVTIDDTLDMDHYLTDAEARQCLESIETVRTSFENTSPRLEPLAEVDKAAYAEIDTTLDSLESRVHEYNEQFLNQELDRFNNTFSGLGNEELTLNDSQNVAVMTNEVHNRVIAGPGTGKTFSLACRAKYLVDKGTPPDRILALSFNRDAASEISSRINDLFGITNIDARTLHSMGGKITRKANPDHTTLVNVQRMREIGRYRRQLLDEDPTFRHHYEQFQEAWQSEQLSMDHQEQKQYVESLKYSSSKTRRGETLDPTAHQERDAHRKIADMLFEYGIEYRYRQFDAAVREMSDETVIPDFTLPDQNVTIEYYPSSRVQSQKDQYNKKQTLKLSRQAQQQAHPDRKVIAIHGDDHSLETIPKLIRAKLDTQGVDMSSRRSERDQINAAYTHVKTITEVEEALSEFVKKAKSTGFEPSDLERLDKEEDPMVYHFSHAAAILLNVYQDTYDRYDALDYEDMILEAVDLLTEGVVSTEFNYDHFLIDEFQDLDRAQIRMVQELLNINDRPHLYAVGDDWQSINGFRGARPEYFTDFEDNFSPAETTELTVNYRCPPAVVDASNRLMSERSGVVPKSLEAESSAETIPTVHRVGGQDEFQYVTNGVHCICQLVGESVSKAGRSPDEILVIARNERGSRFMREIREGLEDRGIPIGDSDGVRVTTAHSAKGTEAEHVIIANAAANRSDGFPSTGNGNQLTKVVDPQETKLAEERRLFYVAITRTKDRLDIQTDSAAVSPFITDIEEFIETVHVPFNTDCDRVNIECVAKSTAQRSRWEIEQLGTLRLKNGYEFNYVVSGDGESESVETLTQGTAYQLSGIKVDEYDNRPQLKIDADTKVSRE